MMKHTIKASIIAMTLFRLLSAQPMADGETIKITGALHNDDWYLDAYGQNPSPFYRNPFINPIRPPYPWKPGFATWSGRDALFPTIYGMKIAINNANSPATLDITGALPVNIPPSGGNAPLVPLQGTTANTGGGILPGLYMVAISASAAGPTSNFVTVVVPTGTSTNTITVSGVAWTAAAVGPIAVYVGPDSQHMFAVQSAWVGSSLDTFGNPTAFTVKFLQAPGPFTQSDGIGLPDIKFSNMLIQAKNIVHGGVWGSAPTSVGVTGGFGTATFAGASWTVNQWAGRVLSSYAATPLNLLITSNTTDTLTFSINSHPLVGDPVVMRAKADTITTNTITDASFINFYAPSGLIVGAEAGNMLRIVAGTGAGQPPLAISSNTSTSVTIAGTWYTTPDATSVWIIESPTWTYQKTTDTVITDGAAAGSTVIGSLPIGSFMGGSLLVEAVTMDSDSNWSIERYAPIREIYVPAQPIGGGADVTINGSPVTY